MTPQQLNKCLQKFCMSAKKREGTFYNKKIPYRYSYIAQRELFCPTIYQYIVTNKVTLWSASYSACVVYTKTIIQLSVGERGGYLPTRKAVR